MERVSMQDVADAAKVSRMTVSYALRNDRRITEATRSRIKALAEKMGYRPDPLIQRLATHLGEARRSPHASTLGLVTCFSEREGARSHFPRYFCGIEQRARQLGFKLEEFWLREKGMNGMKASRIMAYRGIHGLILAPVPVGGGHLRMDWEKFAVAALGSSMVRPLVHRVTNYQLHSAREIIRRMNRVGHRRIGLCIGEDYNRRVDYAWQQAMLGHQAEISPKSRVRPMIQDGISKAALLKWVRAEKPDGIIAHDQIFRSMLEEEGYRVPENIGIALTDWCSYHQDFAGIDQHSEEIGKACVDLVVGQLYRNERGLPEHPRTVMIEGKWRAGASVRAAAGFAGGRETAEQSLISD